MLAVVYGVCAAVASPLPGDLHGQVTRADTARGRPATLVGRIRGRGGEGPIAGVRVIVRRSGADERAAVVEVDSVGAFRLALAGGAYRVTFQRIGYKELTEEVRLEPGVRTELTVDLVADALDLKPVVVRVTRRGPWFMRDFERRRATMLGSFVDRTQIEHRHARFLSDLFLTVPSIRVVPDADGRRHLLMRGSCAPQVYIDGVATYDRAGIDATLRPEDIEAIEVYSSASVPIEYQHGSCGAVLVWSRPPGRGQGRAAWWKPLLVLGGAFGLLMAIR